MGDVVIYGAGGFGREVLWILRTLRSATPDLRTVGFVDDDSRLHGTAVCGVPVLGALGKACAGRSVSVALGVGEPSAKRRIVERARALQVRYIQVVHPSSAMSEYVELGEGVVLAAGAILTTQVSIGRWVTLNIGCTIGHDVTVGDYCTLAPGSHISGEVALGEGVKIGTGAVVLPGVRVGAWSVVGAGAVVTKDLPAGVVAVGVPARVTRELENTE